MKIVWLCATPLPEAQKALQLNCNVGMSWLVGTANQLKTICDMHLLFPQNSTKEIIQKQFNHIHYVGVPIRTSKLAEYDNEMKYVFKAILEDIKPDIIHIWGTEFPFEYSMVEALACLKMLDRCVVWIQGLVSIYSYHFMGALPTSVLLKPSLGDLLRRETIWGTQRSMKKRGEFEAKIISQAKHVIGRTSWDLACCKQINPEVQYHKCNETLRNSFYTEKWELFTCKKHSIFVSQGGYPIKGLDVIIRAAGLLKSKYPDLEINIAGDSALVSPSFRNRVRRRNYENYYLKLIVDNGLSNKVNFLGEQNEEQMVQQYNKAHIFVLPSIIENSPNSLGEAMVVGTPTIASYCGGIPQLFRHDIDGFLFQPGSYYMLAHYIDTIFSHDDTATYFSINSRLHGRETHNPEANNKNLLKIYEDLSKNGVTKYEN